MFAGPRLQGVCLRACHMQLMMIVVVVAAACGVAVSVAWPASCCPLLVGNGARTAPASCLCRAGGWLGFVGVQCMCGRWLRAGVTVSCRRALTHVGSVQVAVRCCAGAVHGKATLGLQMSSTRLAALRHHCRWSVDRLCAVRC